MQRRKEPTQFLGDVHFKLRNPPTKRKTLEKQHLFFSMTFPTSIPTSIEIPSSASTREEKDERWTNSVAKLDKPPRSLPKHNACKSMQCLTMSKFPDSMGRRSFLKRTKSATAA